MSLVRFIRTAIACLGLFTALTLSAKTIVAVDSYNAAYPWSKTNRQGLVENIAKEHSVTFFEMDTKRIPSAEHANKADEVWSKIEKLKPDLVVTMDDNALKHLGERITGVGYPLVFLGVNHDPRMYFKDESIPHKVTGVLERPLLFQNITYISKIVPMGHHRMLLIMDGGATSTGFHKSALDSRKKITVEDISLDVYVADSFQSWQSKINALTQQDYDAILVGSFSTLQQKASSQVTDTSILEWTSEHSPIPLFTFWEHRIGPGKTIGGLVISGYEHGKIAAQKANIILENGTFPLIEISKIGEPIFSESQLSRWGIKLPGYIRARSTMLE